MTQQLLLLLLLLLGLFCLCHTGFDSVLVAVPQGSTAILPCVISSREDIQTEVFDWKKVEDRTKEVFLYDRGPNYNKGREGQDLQFHQRVFHFQDELKNGNASIKILRTTLADSGNYTCTFPERHVSHVQLVVGAASKPVTRILSSSESGVLLQCEVLGASPEPEVQWQNSSGNIIDAEEPEISERGGSYDVILRTTVTKTDFYQCVVTQEKIKHQVHTETLVLVPETLVPDHSEQHTGWTPGINVGAIVGAIVGTLLFVVIVQFVLIKSGRLRCADAKNSTINGDAAVGHPLVPTGC